MRSTVGKREDKTQEEKVIPRRWRRERIAYKMANEHKLAARLIFMRKSLILFVIHYEANTESLEFVTLHPIAVIYPTPSVYQKHRMTWVWS